MKKNHNPLINSRKNSWIKSIYALFAIAIPALLLWIFFSDDFLKIQPLPVWARWLIAIGFVIVSTLVTAILIYFKILEVNVLAFSLPVAICFMVIFLTGGLEAWIRALIVLPFMLLTIPINIICKKIELKLNYQNKNKKQSEKKIKNL